MPARRKRGEKLWKGLSVLEEARPGRRARTDVPVDRVGEEPWVHEAADDRIGRLERVRQRAEDVVAVDPEPRGRREAVAEDRCDHRAVGLAEQGTRDVAFDVTQ